MWAILLTVIVSGYNHAAVTTQLVGSYDSVDRCVTISKQLQQREYSTSDGLGYIHSKEVTARCVQVK